MGQLKKILLPLKQILLQVDPILKGYVVQESKQEVIKVTSPL